MALSFARDEFHWLLRHAENVPVKRSAGTKAEDYVDRSTTLLHLLFTVTLQ